MKIHWCISWQELFLLESDGRGVSGEEIKLLKVKVELLAVS